MGERTSDSYDAFIIASVVPRNAAHVSGDLSRSRSLLSAHPELARRDIYTASIVGDHEAVRDFVARDAALATARGGPNAWDALTYLCFSRYLRLERERSDDFVRAATALLDAGASANSGFWEDGHQPRPEWESVLYGAAGVAHHAPLTRLLLDRGADPNDEEVPYHAPEGWDNAALVHILESGRVTEDSLAMMLLRKADWHDLEGIRLILDHGGDPNRKGRWGKTPLDHALRSDNALSIIELLLDRGADPTIESQGVSAVAKAARHGRGDVLALFARRGIPMALEGIDQFLAACARDDADGVLEALARHPELRPEVLAHGGVLLATFARVGNRGGVQHLLDAGIDVDATFAEGEGYFDIAPASTALHVAAWRGWPPVVRLLIARGADVHRRDGRGRTPLALAVRACVDSYWTDRRSPDSVQALLAAGATLDGVRVPCGYDAVDALLVLAPTRVRGE